MPINNSGTFGERLRKARLCAGLSQTELAAQLDVSQPAVVQWEKNLSSIRLEPLLQIIKILDVSPDELLGSTGNSTVRPGPISKLSKCLETASLLPQKQQKQIVEVLEALVQHHQLSGSPN